METYIHTYKPSQWMKLQLDIGRFPTTCGTSEQKSICSAKLSKRAIIMRASAQIRTCNRNTRESLVPKVQTRGYRMGIPGSGAEEVL